MVVDDDPDVSRALAASLDAEGYEVELCQHGRDAIERLELGSRPDVIVLDLMMPVLNGLEAPRGAAQRRALVGDSRHRCVGDPRVLTEDLGVHCSLEKPFQLEDLFGRSRPDQGACGLQEPAAK